MKQPFFNILRVLVSSIFLITLCFCAWSQTQTPAPTRAADLKANQAVVRTEIEKIAARDAKRGQEQLDSIHKEYDENNAGLSPAEIGKIYRNAFDKATEENTRDPIQEYWQSITLTALLMAILAWFKDTIKDFIKSILNALKNWFVRRITNTRWGKLLALRKYFESVVRNNKRLKTPFGEEHSQLEMSDVYVPLKVAGTSGDEIIDPFRALKEWHRLVVLGPPGSGKSMLLRRIALTYAQGQLSELPSGKIPVLLELHRLNDPKLTLQQHLVEEFSRNEFPNAGEFVTYHLELGSLLILLDGLDEVNSSQRTRVVQEIRDLSGQYESCRVMITCRNAVYHNELDFIAERTLTVEEFTDQQIRRFLHLWWVANKVAERENAANKSVDHLMKTLDERPLIKALARNPLLLTIIAHLYAKRHEWVLPHSRAEFYTNSTQILLDSWERLNVRTPNKYDPNAKSRLLGYLAFEHQSSADAASEDKRSMRADFVLSEAKKILPNLNIKAEEAPAVLQEIVERSGLLLEIDNHEKYTFAHLTLQEYFTAAHLMGRETELLTKFKADPNGWRETVKLWCGLVPDSTNLINDIWQIDPLMAFECLADAKTVDSSLSSAIIESFQAQLGTDDKDDIPKAFAAVASVTNMRGEPVLQFLGNVIEHDNAQPARRIAAANALSFTNLPSAAHTLAHHAHQKKECRSALLRMGDLAVPSLRVRAEAGNLEALADLQEIGTPSAAETLTNLIWTEDAVAHRAAFHLAALFSKPEIEESLRDFPLTDLQRRAPQIAWVWEPFNEPHTSALPVVAGRIAHLLTQIPENELPAFQLIDPRLVVPLCITEPRGGIILHDAAPVVRDFYQVKATEAPSLPVMSEFKGARSVLAELCKTSEDESIALWRERFLREAVSFRAITIRWRFLFECLPLQTRCSLLQKLLTGRQPDASDWRNLFNPISYSFDRSWHFRTVFGMVFLLSLLGMTQTVLSIWQSSTWFTWINDVLVAFTISGFLLWLLLIYGNFFSDPAPDSLSVMSGPSGWVILIKRIRENFKMDLITLWLYLTCLVSPLISAYFVTMFGLRYMNWFQVSLLWIGIHVFGILLWKLGRWRERAARNPLYGILKPPENFSSLSPSRSGILNRWLRKSR